LKKLIIISAVSISMLITGCAASNTVKQETPTPQASSIIETQTPEASEANSGEKTSPQPYTITTVVYSQDNIKVQYPQLEGMADSSKEKAINALIKTDVISSQVEEPIKSYQDDSGTPVKLTLNLAYKVTMYTSELFSVYYTGDSYIEGGVHPDRSFYATTIDLKNTAKLSLSDFTTIDNALVQKIKKSTDITEAVDGVDSSVLIPFFQDESDQVMLQELQDQYAYFFITPDSLAICISVPHVMGDYAVIKLPR